MKVQVIRVEEKINSFQLEYGNILDIDMRWLPEDIRVDDIFDFNVEVVRNGK